MSNKHYAIIGISACILFWLTYLVMSNLRPNYSLFTKAISELGSLDAPNKWVWNIFGYILPGLMISIYSFPLFKSVSMGSGSRVPLLGFVLSGLFMCLSGIFPGDFENKQSTTMLFHTIGSLGSYLFFLIGAFTYPVQMRKSPYWKQSVKPTLTFTWITIIFGAWPFVFTSFPSVGQRIVFLLYFLWIIYTAILLYKKPER